MSWGWKGYVICIKNRWKCLSVTQIQSTVEQTREGANHKATPQHVARRTIPPLNVATSSVNQATPYKKFESYWLHAVVELQPMYHVTQLSFRLTRLNLVSIVWLTISPTRYPVSRRYFPQRPTRNPVSRRHSHQTSGTHRVSRANVLCATETD